eukprot:m51a1_g11184 hypothetical protein (163) ;mRNA; r:5672-6160
MTRALLMLSALLALGLLCAAAPTDAAAWTLGAWTMCGTDCTQTRDATCTQNGSPVDPSLCDASAKPAASDLKQSCKGGWCPGPSQCLCVCGSGWTASPVGIFDDSGCATCGQDECHRRYPVCPAKGQSGISTSKCSTSGASRTPAAAALLCALTALVASSVF